MDFVESVRLEDVRFPLRRRVAVVTGGAAGIGAAIAQSLHLAGAAVALIDKSRHDLRRTLDDMAGDEPAISLVADVRDRHTIDAARRRVHAELGEPDLVVVNAGVMFGGDLIDSDDHESSDMLAVNVGGMITTAREFLPGLRAAAEAGGPADLVLVGSIAGSIVFPGFAAYSATQAAIRQLARTLRAEESGSGVRVKHLEPGVTLTDLGARISSAEARREVDALRSFELPLTPDDVAHAVTFAASLPAHVNLAELTVIPTGHGRLGAV